MFDISLGSLAYQIKYNDLQTVMPVKEIVLADVEQGEEGERIEEVHRGNWNGTRIKFPFDYCIESV